MGLVNSNGEYVRITNIDFEQSRVFIETWKNQGACRRPTKWDRPISDSIHCGQLGECLAASPKKKTRRDDIWTAAYEALKCEPPYNGAVKGDAWSDDL